MARKKPARLRRELRQAPPANLSEPLARALGAAVYTTDVALPHSLQVAVARCPHPHARVRAIDAEAARKAAGVKAVQVLLAPGSEISRLGAEVALVVAESRTQAQAALRLLRIELEALPAPAPAFGFATPAEEAFQPAEIVGSPVEVLSGAAFHHRGVYGWERQTLAEWEAHSFVCEPVGDALHVWAATEDPSRLASELAAALALPAEKVQVVAQHVGASFGSRVRLQPIDLECARLARRLGAPLRLVFDRLSELVVGSHREARSAEIELGADKDGHFTAWRSRAWGAAGGGSSPAGAPPPPPFAPQHRSTQEAAPVAGEAVSAPRGAPEEASSYFMACAVDDLAAQMGQSPLDVLLLNVSLTEPFGDRVHALLREAETHAGWKARWHPRGDVTEGPVKRGLGLGFGSWIESGKPSAPPTGDDGAAAKPAAALALAVAEVAVDRQTGIATIEKVTVIGEGGKGGEAGGVEPAAPPVDHKLLEAELSRGAVQGISQTLFEEGDRGRIAGACEVGEVVVRLVQTGPATLLDGAALAARFATPGAVANAIANALGLRIPLVPITPERILAAVAPPPDGPAKDGA